MVKKMVFRNKTDWTECLRKEDKDVLKEILSLAGKHRCAYIQADDVRIAQLWCALIELKRIIDEQQRVIRKLSEPFKRIVEVGEAEKRKAIRKLVSSIVQPKSEEEKESVEKLVETLMKF